MSIIGIDLGTSKSAATILRGGRPVMISSAEGITLGGKAFPNYVAVTVDGQMLVGEPARRQTAANPDGTASAFKRRMTSEAALFLSDGAGLMTETVHAGQGLRRVSARPPAAPRITLARFPQGPWDGLQEAAPPLARTGPG
jgi:molecular chaperone DnaK (HSP70)